MPKMSKASANVKVLVRPPSGADRIAGTVLDDDATDATCEWLVLIGGDAQASDAVERVSRYLREMWPEVDPDCVSGSHKH